MIFIEGYCVIILPIKNSHIFGTATAIIGTATGAGKKTPFQYKDITRS